MEEKLSKVLRSAAENRALRDALLNDRDRTVNSLDLSAVEKSILRSVPDEQLKKMIKEMRKPWKLTISPMAKLAIGVGAIAVAAYNCDITRGITHEITYEYEAINGLEHIHAAEQVYKNSYGVYGTMDNLLKNAEARDLIGTVFEDNHYRFELKTNGKTYTAKAEHDRLNNTRPSFRVGPDGKIEKIKPDKE